MLILAFDTTAAACSVALWRDGTIVSAACEAMGRGHAEALVPMIEALMARAGITYTSLDRIAVTVGPGSFTGVRVGLATARGLGLAAAKAVVGVTTTEVLAAAVPPAALGGRSRILVAIDTKRGDLYVQQFDGNAQPLTDIIALSPPALDLWLGSGPLVVVGDGAALVAAAVGPNAVLSQTTALPDPAVIASLAATRTPHEGGPLPLYIHPPAAALPTAAGTPSP